MTPKLDDTNEIRDALRREPTKPLRVEDTQTKQIYLIFPEHALPTLWDDYIHREVQRGLDQLDRGESQAWDVEAFLTDAHRRHVSGFL
jgi:hypothetical protein